MLKSNERSRNMTFAYICSFKHGQHYEYLYIRQLGLHLQVISLDFAQTMQGTPRGILYRYFSSFHRSVRAIRQYQFHSSVDDPTCAKLQIMPEVRTQRYV